MRISILTFLVTLFVFQPVWGQSKKELAAQDVVLAERIARLEARMLTGDPAAEQLTQRMDALEAEQRSLTGEIEQLRFERDKLKAEIKALSQDLVAIEELSERMQIHLDAVDLVARERSNGMFDDQRMAGGTGSTVPMDSIGGAIGEVDPNQPSAVPGPPTSREITVPFGSTPSEVMNGTVPDSNIANLPELGKEKLFQGNFTGAQSDFQTYLAVEPDAPNAGEVSFWLAETHYVKGGYADAADAYINSMRKSPNGIKAPDALIGLAKSLRELGNKPEACQALDSFSSQFPNATADAREKARVEIARTGC